MTPKIKSKSKITTKKGSDPMEVNYKVNINTADDKELLSVFKTEELVWAVKSGRPYNSIEELYRVEGIDEDLFEKIRDRIIVEDFSEQGFMGVADVRESEELQEGVIPGFDMEEPEEFTGAKDLRIAVGEINDEEAEMKEMFKIIKIPSELERLEVEEELLTDQTIEEEREIIPGYEAETKKMQGESDSERKEDETGGKHIPRRKSKVREKKSNKKPKGSISKTHTNDES
jgi:hypothetical protein